MAARVTYPSLKAGMNNRAVKAMQNGLHRYLHTFGIKHVNLRNGGYGSNTIADVNRFKNHSGIRPVLGRVFGSDAWKKLDPYLGEYDYTLLRRHLDDVKTARARIEAEKAAQQAASDPRSRLVAVALRFYENRDSYRYVQTRPFPSCLFCAEAFHRLDCSSSVSLIYREAGLLDPNGFGHNGYGFTGSLWSRGSAVDTPRAGDLCFYGRDSRGPYPSHVAIAISSREVVSFGSNPVRRAAVRYRSDYQGARSYL